MVQDIVEEKLQRGLSMIESCSNYNATCRLLGGIAIAYLVRDIYPEVPALRREPKDVDLAAHKKDSQKITKALESIGIQSDRQFNALHGWERLKFRDPKLNMVIDVFLDVFRESHVIELKNRLEKFSPTIPPSDLLMTKFQIWEINEKDLKDIVAMLYKFDLGDKDTNNTIDLNRIIELTSDDWGLYKTTIVNLDRTINYMNSTDLPGKAKDRVMSNIDKLRQSIEKAPKSMKWKMRATIGEKVKWYETPEEA
ncbi:MAG: hypothetical protein ACP5GZ_03470 [Vulcanisaeta sp.]|uniref:Uncharacterized protein n=1 Tax=Vulcanisaeta moutnovskia (strain 768-28) TaxID=985053 RepID=F0QYF3_VULM7|nr:hypothetical protein [Vulcanisaeta moutnovskia]ADY01386.1 hypothetical protein VMUT_1181 [Vulcanisaeta moutnovskia 768-28]